MRLGDRKRNSVDWGKRRGKKRVREEDSNYMSER